MKKSRKNVANSTTQLMCIDYAQRIRNRILISVTLIGVTILLVITLIKFDII